MPAVFLFVFGEIVALSTLDLVLEFVDTTDTECSQVGVCDLDGQITDGETSFGYIQRGVAADELLSAGEGHLTLGEFGGCHGGCCGCVWENHTFTHQVEVTLVFLALLRQVVVLDLLGLCTVHSECHVQHTAMESEFGAFARSGFRGNDTLVH